MSLSLIISFIFSYLTLSLSLSIGGITKWESVDCGPSIIAPYGTKVGALTGPGPSYEDTNKQQSDLYNLTESDIFGGSGNSNSNGDVSVLVDDVEWRFNITAGTLLDAKDQQNVWYQVSHAFYLPL